MSDYNPNPAIDHLVGVNHDPALRKFAEKCLGRGRESAADAVKCQEALLATIKQYTKAGNTHEHQGDCEGARQLRATGNMMGTILHGNVPEVLGPITHIPRFPVGHSKLDPIAVDLTVKLGRFPTWEEVQAEADVRIRADLDAGHAGKAGTP